jgi:hypothetical protein
MTFGGSRPFDGFFSLATALAMPRASTAIPTTVSFLFIYFSYVPLLIIISRVPDGIVP